MKEKDPQTSHEQNENRKRWKNERTETNGTKVEKPMAQLREKMWIRTKGKDGVSSCASRMIKESLLVIMIEQEQFCV